MGKTTLHINEKQLLSVLAGKLVRRVAKMHGGGCFGIPEGGYNHRVLGQNVMAFIEGMEGEQKRETGC
jgi:acetoin utilization deacetylase AcuC-like enzyme